MSCLACCGCGPTDDSSDDPLVDVDRVLQDYVWQLASLRWWQRLQRRRYELEVNWCHLARDHEIQRFTCRERGGADCSGLGGKGGKSQPSKVATRELCLFRTQFTNETAVAQTYTFRTQRETCSTCSVSVQKGYQIGGKLDVKFSIPLPGQRELKAALGDKVDLCDVTGGLSGQFQLSKTRGETFTETLTWSVDSQVQVSPRTKTTASLVIAEKELEAHYTIKTTIRPIRKGVTVYIKDRRSQEIVSKADIPREAFARIFAGVGGFQVDPEKNAREVICETKGTCRLVYGAEQIIRITHEELPLVADAGSSNVLQQLPSTSEGCTPIIEEQPDEGDMDTAKNTAILAAS